MQAEASPFVLDGGFEIPTPSGSVGYTGSLGDGWTVTSGTIGVENAGFGGTPHSGSQFAYLDWGFTSNTLSQTLSTVAGQSYVISFWVADTSANSLGATFDGHTLFSGTAPTNGVSTVAEWMHYAFMQTASTASTVLSFNGQYTAGFGTILDDVTVTSAAVPEPATIGFTGVGCLALFALRRKRT